MIILYIILMLLAVLIAALLAAVLRTLAMPRKQTNYVPSMDEKRIGEYAEKLSRMVQVETISDRSKAEVEKFRGFHKLMQEQRERARAARGNIGGWDEGSKQQLSALPKTVFCGYDSLTTDAKILAIIDRLAQERQEAI